MNGSNTLERAEVSPNELSETDASLKRVVDVIVTEFHGDTVAYYESIRANSESGTTDCQDAATAASHTKSHQRVGSRGSKTK